jgi:hypothetical protein
VSACLIDVDVDPAVVCDGGTSIEACLMNVYLVMEFTIGWRNIFLRNQLGGLREEAIVVVLVVVGYNKARRLA